MRSPAMSGSAASIGCFSEHQARLIPTHRLTHHVLALLQEEGLGSFRASRVPRRVCSGRRHLVPLGSCLVAAPSAGPGSPGEGQGRQERQGRRLDLAVWPRSFFLFLFQFRQKTSPESSCPCCPCRPWCSTRSLVIRSFAVHGGVTGAHKGVTEPTLFLLTSALSSRGRRPRPLMRRASGRARPPEAAKPVDAPRQRRSRRDRPWRYRCTACRSSGLGPRQPPADAGSS